MGSVRTPLVIEPATADDIEALNEIWFTAFAKDAGMMRLFPDTPVLRGWMADCHAHDFKNRPYQFYLKVVDPDTKDAQGRPSVVAYGKWDSKTAEFRGPRFLPWAEETPADECTKVFNMLEANRRRVMGDVEHCYLDTLCTLPEYERRGAGSMLVKWGCDFADKHGLPAYVDASKFGAPLYEKFGFVDRSLPDQGEIASMTRPKTTA